MNQETQLAQAFKEIFNVHFPTVRNFARMLLKSEEDAEDIAQDVFAKLWTQPDTWTGTDPIEPYLYVLTKNTTFNFIKHKKIEQTYQEKLITPLSPAEELFDTENPLDTLYYKEIRLIAKLTIERLPKRRREIFEMSRFRQMSNQEIADTLQISVRTVEHQIYLTLSDLKKILYVSTFFLFF